MGIQIPLYLINQTGPEWDKFVADAKKAGIAANQVGDAADRVVDVLSGRNAQIAKNQINALADSFGKVEDKAKGLVGTVKYLNAMNITPRGYEMFSYRMSMMATNLGAAVVPLAAVAAAGYAGVKSYKALLEAGDETAKGLDDAFTRLGKSTDSFWIKLGKTDFVQGEIRGLTVSVESLEDMMLRGIPTIKGFFATLTGNKEGMRAAKREIDEINKGLEEAETARRDKEIGGVFDRLDKKNRKTEFQRELSGVDSRNELSRREQKIRDRLQKAKGEMNDEGFAEVKAESEEQLIEIQNRRNELLRDEEKLNKEIAKIEHDRAEERSKADNPFDVKSSKEITDQIEQQLRLAKDQTRTEGERKKSLEEIKRLQKDLEESRKREAHHQDAQLRFDQARIHAAQKLAAEKARQLAHDDAIHRRVEAHRENDRRQKFANEFERQAGQFGAGYGGEGGAQGFLDNIDPRKIRQRIGNNRAQRQQALLGAAQRDQLRNFQGNDDDRAALIARQKRDMDQAKKQAKAQGFRDFNRGNIDENEFKNAQQEVFRDLVQDAQRKGTISRDTAKNMLGMAQALQDQQALSQAIQRDLDRVRAVLNGINQAGVANRARKAGMNVP